MSHYEAHARSNYVPFRHVARLAEKLQPYHIRISEHRSRRGHFALFCEGVQGWPSWFTDEQGQSQPFRWEGVLKDHLPEGEVLVLTEAGYERGRYCVGFSGAFVLQGGQWKSCAIDIRDIYHKASEEFGIPINRILPSSH